LLFLEYLMYLYLLNKSGDKSLPCGTLAAEILKYEDIESPCRTAYVRMYDYTR